MTTPIKLTITLLISLLMTSCFSGDFVEGANQQFGDQHFKTAISLIELHKIREGEYPKDLHDIEYLGDWDAMIYHSVKYTKLQEGYDLDLINGWVGKPEELVYPVDFWKGLGLKNSNMKK